jgi:hypothetical protein
MSRHEKSKGKQNSPVHPPVGGGAVGGWAIRKLRGACLMSSPFAKIAKSAAPGVQSHNRYGTMLILQVSKHMGSRKRIA